MQTTYNIPPGCLTEGSIEPGHQNLKKCKSCFSRSAFLIITVIYLIPRNDSFKGENYDIMVHCSCISDILLHWEREHGQQIKPGYMKKQKITEAKRVRILLCFYQLFDSRINIGKSAPQPKIFTRN